MSSLLFLAALLIGAAAPAALRAAEGRELAQLAADEDVGSDDGPDGDQLLDDTRYVDDV